MYEPGKGLAFHFDKDEHAMKEKHQMIQPVLSSVLYLTGDCATERLGEQDLNQRCADTARNTLWCLASQLYNVLLHNMTKESEGAG